MFNKTKPETGSSSGLGIPNPPEPTPYRPSETARPAEPPRPAAPATAGTAGAARSTNLSTLSAGVNYEGNISGSGELQVDGKLKGDIRVARVVIGENGSVEGNVAADVVEIRGRVSGTVAGKSVKLFATSRVEGDVTQEQLSVEQGAWFQGRCIQAKREAPATAAPSPAQAAPDRYQPEKPVAPALPSAKV
ncbi:bactofilin family protein [Brevundimonas variabilis]|uniref:Cytoskeletal protein CcmA (Bactofilin family) n=1 Tax=Brevundimonas variabilis TaxID=74312 RepID=A0A7W9CGZ4_9CAUL|nr:polymer-forming cytoskeletal protein [Brevundimonas variabilis]MBB5745464.1 cytoskeletal protein CcmA (bactofilin family) [Brevundimonas variabilis]